MGKLVLQRLVAVVPLLFIVSILAFSLLQFLPGDPVLVRLGEDATVEQYAMVEAELGLDEAIPVQYVKWLTGVLQADFGTSLVNSQDVTEAVTARLPVTLSLTFGAMAIAIIVGVTAGVIGGTRPGSGVDRGVTFGATLGVAVPNFWFAILLVALLSVNLGWLPATGYTPIEVSFAGWLRSIILPCLALGLSASATIARQTRSGLASVLQQDYIRTALAKGARPRRVVMKHGLKNAFIPVVTVLAFQVTALLGGALVVERVLALPGLGSLAVAAVQQSDVTMVQGIIMFTAVVVVAVNLLTDLTYGYLNPKVRPS